VIRAQETAARRHIAIATASCVALWLASGLWLVLWIGFIPPGAFSSFSYAVDGAAVPPHQMLYEPLVKFTGLAAFVLGIGCGLVVYVRVAAQDGQSTTRIRRIAAVATAACAIWVGLVVPLSLLLP
jgi:hypothetical protein